MGKLFRPHLFVILAVIALVLISAIWLIIVSGLRRVVTDVFRADVIWLLYIVFAQSFAYWSYVIPYKYVFDITYHEALKQSFTGFHPFRAGGGFVYDIKSHKTISGRAKVLYLGLWEYAALAPAVFVAAVYSYADRLIPTQLSLPWVIGVPAGLIVFILALASRGRIRNHPAIKQTLNLIHHMLFDESPRNTLVLVVGMVMYWFGEVMTLYCALQLFDLSLGWFAMLIAYASGYLITRRSLPLGGAGVVLITLSLALRFVGLKLSYAVLVAVTYQVANLAIPLIYGKILRLDPTIR